MQIIAPDHQVWICTILIARLQCPVNCSKSLYFAKVQTKLDRTWCWSIHGIPLPEYFDSKYLGHTLAPRNLLCSVQFQSMTFDFWVLSIFRHVVTFELWISNFQKSPYMFLLFTRVAAWYIWMELCLQNCFPLFSHVVTLTIIFGPQIFRNA